MEIVDLLNHWFRTSFRYFYFWFLSFFRFCEYCLEVGGRHPAPPLLSVPPGGIHWGWGLQSSSINIESIERFKVTADIISVLIHNNTFQSFVWLSIALNIHVFHFENWLFSFVVSLQKWLRHFNCFRNDGKMYKGTSDMPLYKWRFTWNYACILFKYALKI